MIGEQVIAVTGKSSELGSIPSLYLRIDGRTVASVPELLKYRGALAATMFPETLGSQGTGFSRQHDGGTCLSLHVGPDGYSFRIGVSGAKGSGDPGVEIGATPQGPWYKFPLSRKQALEIFGEPIKEETKPRPIA
jgi:hypothetical protein